MKLTLIEGLTRKPCMQRGKNVFFHQAKVRHNYYLIIRSSSIVNTDQRGHRFSIGSHCPLYVLRFTELTITESNLHHTKMCAFHFCVLSASAFLQAKLKFVFDFSCKREKLEIQQI